MKVCIDVDELYPYFTLMECQNGNEIGSRVIELPFDKVKWVEDTMNEFWKVQKYLNEQNADKLEYVL